MDNIYQNIFTTMIVWVKSLVQREERLSFVSDLLTRTSNLQRFLSVARTQPELQNLLLSCRDGDDVRFDAAIDKLISDRLDQIGCLELDFEKTDIDKLKSYLKLWVDVIARG
jgi:hypothetical protein